MSVRHTHVSVRHTHTQVSVPSLVGNKKDGVGVAARAVVTLEACEVNPNLRILATLEVTQGQILSQSPTDATRFWWQSYGS